MYAAPPLLQTEIYSRLPEAIHRPEQLSAWVAARRASGRPPRSNAMSSSASWLVGPSFSRDGTLYCADIPFGRILRLSREGQWDVFAEYDGEPSGLKTHKDGRIFVADHKRGLVAFDPATAKMEVILERLKNEPFRGLSDLTFAANGDLYLTDQGESALTIRADASCAFAPRVKSTCCSRGSKGQTDLCSTARKTSFTYPSRVPTASSAYRSSRTIKASASAAFTSSCPEVPMVRTGWQWTRPETLP
jgi:hypothetical protein